MYIYLVFTSPLTSFLRLGRCSKSLSDDDDVDDDEESLLRLSHRDFRILCSLGLSVFFADSKSG